MPRNKNKKVWIRLRDHTKIIVNILRPIQFPAEKMDQSKLENAMKKTAVTITIGSKRRGTTDLFIGLNNVSSLANLIYTWPRGTLRHMNLGLCFHAEADTDQDAQTKVIAAFKHLRGVGEATVAHANPGIAGKALRDQIMAEVGSFIEGTQKLRQTPKLLTNHKDALEAFEWAHHFLNMYRKEIRFPPFTEADYILFSSRIKMISVEACRANATHSHASHADIEHARKGIINAKRAKTVPKDAKALAEYHQYAIEIRLAKHSHAVKAARTACQLQPDNLEYKKMLEKACKLQRRAKTREKRRRRHSALGPRKPMKGKGKVAADEHKDTVMLEERSNDGKKGDVLLEGHGMQRREEGIQMKD
ncbi:MAG: hypothetical protein Q9181_007293, partial [Wetmoreana brouardii]